MVDVVYSSVALVVVPGRRSTIISKIYLFVVEERESMGGGAFVIVPA